MLQRDFFFLEIFNREGSSLICKARTSAVGAGPIEEDGRMRLVGRGKRGMSRSRIKKADQDLDVCCNKLFLEYVFRL